MQKPSDEEDSRKHLRRQVLGLGESSHQKSYYPQLQQRLRELERLRLLLDHSADALFWTEVPSGQVLDMNARAESFLAQIHDEKSPLFLKNFLSDSAWKRISELFSGPFPFSGTGTAIEADLLSLTGKQIPVEMSVGFHRIEDRVFAIVVARDITERKRSQEKHARLEARLRHSQKMEAVGQLAGGVAHDFNNLLQVIQGNGDMMLLTLDPDNPAQKYIREIMKAVDRARSLVRQLLTFSRRDVPEPLFLDVNHLIRNLANMLQRLIGTHIRLTLKCDAPLPPVWADPVQMEQVLINLCVNARDAMPKGGGIVIETGITENKDKISHNNLQKSKENRVVISVSDTGCGIPREIQDRIFEPFFTTKEVGKGTGLGLSTVYAIVEQHKGSISFSSEPGKGTRFRIALPSASGREKQGNSSETPGCLKGKGETILVAEDDAQVRKMDIDILEKAGYHVLAARDGDEATRIFLLNEDKVDLALLDMIMPGKNGRAVFAFIQEHSSRIPVLFTTGCGFDTTLPGSVPEEKARLLPKPHTAEQLLAAVRNMLDRGK
ncbi:MAG: ATP-binding protein [Desulfobacterales bacterium]